MAIIKNPIIIKQESGGGVDYLALKINGSAGAPTYTYTNNELTTLASYAFYYDDKITQLSMANVSKVNTYAAYNCINLASISFPNLTNIQERAFMQCSSLTSIDLPNVTSIGKFGFCLTPLTSINVPKLEGLSESVFSTSAFASASFPKVWSWNGSRTFENNPNLTTLTFAHENLPNSRLTLPNINCLPASSTHHINIYVPAKLIDSYKVGTNWSTLYNNGYISFYPITGTSFNITTSVTNGSYSGATTIVESGTATVTLTASSGYDLPSSITVTGASYTYNSTTGVVSLSSPTGNVSITAVCTQQVSGYTVSVASFGSSPYGHGHTYYSLDDGSTWVEITGAGTLTTSATQVKFKATSDDYMMESVKLASTTLGLTLYNDYWNAGISSNYTLSSNVTDITIEFYDID